MNRITAAVLLATALSACSGSEGSNCAKDADCGQGLACLSPHQAAKVEGLDAYTCQSPEGVQEARQRKISAEVADHLRARAERKAGGTGAP